MPLLNSQTTGVVHSSVSQSVRLFVSQSVRLFVRQSVRLFATPWTLAHQASLSMKFSRQEYWCGQLFSFLGNLPDSGIEPQSPALQAESLPSEPPGKPFCRSYTSDQSRSESETHPGSTTLTFQEGDQDTISNKTGSPRRCFKSALEPAAPSQAQISIPQHCKKAVRNGCLWSDIKHQVES